MRHGTLNGIRHAMAAIGQRQSFVRDKSLLGNGSSVWLSLVKASLIGAQVGG
jgi:hypothetical protein